LTPPKNIGYGCTVLSRGLANHALDGIGTYTFELGCALAATGTTCLVPTTFFPGGEHTLENIFTNEAPLLSNRFSERALASALSGFSFFDNRAARERFSLYHATDHLIPKLSGVNVVATIMDAIPLSHPQWIRQNHAALKRWLFRRTASWAQHIITISEFSKQEIVEHFNIPAERISVTPLGVDGRYFEVVDENTCGAIRAKFGLNSQFFLFLGTLQPRKNVAALLTAHSQLPDALRTAHPLVIAGRAGWNCDALIENLRDPKHEGKVFWLEYVTDLEKRALLASALSLVFVSHYEGFGLPVAEAFAAQLPVITANTSSLVEVAGDAALAVDPDAPEAIAHAMRRMMDEPSLRATLTQRGLARAKHYTWAACAEATQRIYAANT
jgi:glycosyltransferase involved in cell wall biosynthesis